MPTVLSSFVGRDQEQADVVRMLDSARLVTLVGSPGVGKTRLALEVARKLVDRYRDGVWVVQLEAVSDPALLPVAVATTLAVREQSGFKLVDTLLDALGHKHLLLVLDNAEHLIEECASLSALVLQNCDNIWVLATSREPLGVGGECVRRIGALGVPPVGTASADVLLQHDSGRLFADRAASIEASFTLDERTGPVVAEICRQLDGLPLAIELAAARLDMLSPEEVLIHLDERFRLLRGGPHSGPAEQKTLLGAIEWSHRLLSPAEAALLRRLSVFVEGCTLEAAEAVCAGDDVPAESVMEHLGALVRKSLVCADNRRAETRYRLLETIRHYALSKLDAAGERARVSARHCRWAVEFAERAEAGLGGGTSPLWLERLDAEHDNLRAAFDWALAEGDTENALRLGGALPVYWFSRGRVGEGTQVLESALCATGGEPPAVRAKALWGAAFLMGMAGDVGQAIPLVEECDALAMEGGEPSLRARARHLLGVLTVYQSPPRALPLLEKNVALARREGDEIFLAWSLASLGSACILLGDTTGARRHFQECLEIGRRTGKRSMEAGARGGLGQAAFIEGDYGSAEAHLRQALALARQEGARGEEAVVLSWLGELLRGRGDYADAHARLHEGLALAREMGPPFSVARCLCFAGRVALAQGDLGGAGSRLSEALSIAREVGLTYLVTRCLLGLAELALLKGDRGDAQGLVEEALTVAQANGDQHAVGAAWHVLAKLARSQALIERAHSLCQRALTVQNDIGDVPGMVSSLELAAGLRGPGRDAVRLFAAAAAIRHEGHYARGFAEADVYASDVALAREALGGEQFAEAWAEGSSLSSPDALVYAARRRGLRHRPLSGPACLTRAELDVAMLAAQGLTNREIGERLFVSPRTVAAHLTHVFSKLGIHSRSELDSFLAEQAPGESRGTDRRSAAGGLYGAGRSAATSL